MTSHLPPLGVVRAGQWSRRLIINDGLEQGSQLPYIKRAIDRGYSVLVMNTNLNKDLSSDKVCVKYSLCLNIRAMDNSSNLLIIQNLVSTERIGVSHS